ERHDGLQRRELTAVHVGCGLGDVAEGWRSERTEERGGRGVEVGKLLARRLGAASSARARALPEEREPATAALELLGARAGDLGEPKVVKLAVAQPRPVVTEHTPAFSQKCPEAADGRGVEVAAAPAVAAPHGSDVPVEPRGSGHEAALVRLERAPDVGEDAVD